MNAYYGPGGALVTDEPIHSITQELDDDCAAYYGKRYFIGESLQLTAARYIATNLGLTWGGTIQGIDRS